MIKIEPEVEVYALGKHIPMSSHKARRVIYQIWGYPYDETLMIPELMSYQERYPIFQLISFAATNVYHNQGL